MLIRISASSTLRRAIHTNLTRTQIVGTAKSTIEATVSNGSDITAGVRPRNLYASPVNLPAFWKNFSFRAPSRTLRAISWSGEQLWHRSLPLSENGYCTISEMLPATQKTRTTGVCRHELAPEGLEKTTWSN